MTNTKADKSSGPKTELDEKFLAVAARVMTSHGIKSDRGISAALGKHPDFINRIRRGLQSAPPDAWDALFDKYPEARGITNVTAHDGGHAIGTNHGTMNYGPEVEHLRPKRQADTNYYEWGNLLFVPAEIHDALRREAELLKDQISDKERIIKLLEQSLNKPS